MSSRIDCCFAVALTVAALACTAVAIPPPDAPATAPADAQPTVVAADAPPVLRTVAVLGYEAKWLADPTESKAAASALAAIVSDRLASMNDLVVVERAEIDRILGEQKLNLTGLVDESNRVRIGKLLGAKFLLWGQGFEAGEQIYLTTKVVNVETGQFKGVIVQLPLKTGLGEIIARVCDELAEKLPATIQALAPSDTPEVSPVELLKRRIGDAKKSWLVAAVEEHKGPPIIDPAVTNELEHLLSGAGQAVRSLDKSDARAVTEGNRGIGEFDKEKRGDYYVVGEGFSEFGQRLSGDLVTCVARVELKVIDPATGNVLAAGSRESRATDLSELLAAKQALRKAARQLFLDLSARVFPEPAAAGEAAKP